MPCWMKGAHVPTHAGNDEAPTIEASRRLGHHLRRSVREVFAEHDIELFSGVGPTKVPGVKRWELTVGSAAIEIHFDEPRAAFTTFADALPFPGPRCARPRPDIGAGMRIRRTFFAAPEAPRPQSNGSLGGASSGRYFRPGSWCSGEPKPSLSHRPSRSRRRKYQDRTTMPIRNATTMKAAVVVNVGSFLLAHRR